MLSECYNIFGPTEDIPPQILAMVESGVEYLQLVHIFKISIRTHCETKKSGKEISNQEKHGEFDI